ncbi:uncharacterized protein PAC_14854 [Phialocephala subalpina]|uniref:AA9 family lytic polysaccharide monooxygenase n=1 Tax=Phialocephala subalpina TaxID=576137 RepID=A0A1L7XIV0_9HELO|nr:uncharacterized protein PAC_14854 [Phialocephala subalpina]
MRLTLAYGLAALQAVAAHTLFTTLFINDVNQGDGNGGNTYVPRACLANSGSKLSFLFRETPDGTTPGAIDPSHKGPCAVYMKYVETPAVEADGGSWFKIWDDGYDNATSKWCTERLIDNLGLISVNVPADLVDGYYLVRTELLALHEADKTPPDPQFYVGCAQIYLGLPAADGILPNNTVSIPGYLTANDPSVIFNIYNPKWPYIMPGPPPFASGDPSVKVLRVDHDQSFLPTGTIYTNANWWAASTSCFNQTTMCYDTAPPTGSEGCKVWEAKCNIIQAACNASNFIGPPDAFKVLTRQNKLNYTIPAASNLTLQYYGGQYAPIQALASAATLTTNGTSRSMAVPTLNVAMNLTASEFVSTTGLISTSTSTSLHFLSPSGSLQPSSLTSVGPSQALNLAGSSFVTTTSQSSTPPSTFTSSRSSTTFSVTAQSISSSSSHASTTLTSASTSTGLPGTMRTVFITTQVTSTSGLPFVPPSSSPTLVSSSPSIVTVSSTIVRNSTISLSNGTLSISSPPATISSAPVLSTSSSSNGPSSMSFPSLTVSNTSALSTPSSSNSSLSTPSSSNTTLTTPVLSTSRSSNSSLSTSSPSITTSATSAPSAFRSNSSTDTVLQITILPNGNGTSPTPTGPAVSIIVIVPGPISSASTSTSASTASDPLQTYPISTDGRCGGGPNGPYTTCLGSIFGQCCGDVNHVVGVCGATKAHCYSNCQGSLFGMVIPMGAGPDTDIATAALPTATSSAGSRKRSKKTRLLESTARHVEYVGKLKRGRHHWIRRL